MNTQFIAAKASPQAIRPAGATGQIMLQVFILFVSSLLKIFKIIVYPCQTVVSFFGYIGLS